MSEDRETIEIVTPIKGHVLVCQAWINGREKQKIDGAMFKSLDTVGDGTSMRPKMNETMLSAQENASIEVVVLSVDGNSDDVLNQVLDFRVKDFEFVVKNVKAIVDGDLDEKKENASETSISGYSEQAEAESQIPVSA